MRTLTLAQRRERALNNFNEEYIHDIDTAKKIINSFNRLCGLSEKNCYLQNDARFCDRKSTKLSEEKEQKWIQRLNGYLKPYGLHITYGGIYPSIAYYGNDAGGVVIVYYHID